jgi:hypothetical protein
LEFRNALRQRVFRRAITVVQRDASLNAFLADLAAGILIPVSPPLAAVSLEAERLSALHSERLGTRSLDLLHVAAAVVHGSSEFLTFDRRQADLAQSAGLSVPALWRTPTIEPHRSVGNRRSGEALASPARLSRISHPRAIDSAGLSRLTSARGTHANSSGSFAAHGRFTRVRLD